MYTGRNTSRVSNKEADNLPAELLVYIGARVMLIVNLWTEKRLVNGSISTITDILWDIGQDPSVSMLSLLLIYFDKYSGPNFPLYKPKIVPIFPTNYQFEYKGIPCSRTQFPDRKSVV